MIVIDSQENLEINKIYSGLYINKHRDEQGKYFDNPYKVIKQATKEEYIQSCKEDDIDPEPISYNNFYWISVD